MSAVVSRERLRVVCVVGARPNFPKMAPILRAMERHSEIEPILVHTGQHHDDRMSAVFFSDLRLRRPDRYLGVSGGGHAEQIARVALAFDPVLEELRPDQVLVVGDVNSTLACALVAAKRGIRLAHVEAGLRSGDRRMPEELNRILTDSMSDFLFTPSRDADENLRREGIADHKIHFVGNVMVDALLQNWERAAASDLVQRLGLKPGQYGVLTLHRPGNVDRNQTLGQILQAVGRISDTLPIVFPVHPRTAARLAGRVPNRNGRFLLIEPLGYLNFVRLMMSARLVMTDSGGVQEETTVLGVPCLTLRENTERPVTVTSGTNRIAGVDPAEIVRQARLVLSQPVVGHSPAPSLPERWDGRAAERVVETLLHEPARRSKADCALQLPQSVTA